MKCAFMISVLLSCIITFFVKADTPQMVPIPGGEFEMGDHFGDGSSNELPVHMVYVDSFHMSRYEVTNQKYCDYLNSAYPEQIKLVGGVVYATSDSSNSYPYCNTHSHDADSQIDFSGGVFSVRTKGERNMFNDPMVQVSWYGAVAFCNWLSEQEEYEQCYDLSVWNCDFLKYGYRLPTEAEWEYAARGGLSGSRFPWGDTINHDYANYWANGSAYSYDTSPYTTYTYHPTWNDGVIPYTSPVSSFSTNGFGLFNIAGNVWEWCNDRYSSTYYSSSPQNNPTGPISGNERVIRGGGWMSTAGGCRVSERLHHVWTWRDADVGFRIILKSPYTVVLTATNKWDGKTIDLSWSSGIGSVKIYRKKESEAFEHIATVQGLSYPNIVPEPGKNYTYVLKNSSGAQISNEANVKAEVIVVLVRGYSTTKPVNPNYWLPEGHSELVDVNQWFKDNGVTCWVPPQSGELGQGLHGWKSIRINADELEAFINSKFVGKHQNAKVNLIGHSAGGLVARDYVKNNPGVVNNIFSINTPHTGTSLAEITELWPVAPQYSPGEMTIFNLSHRQADLGNTKLYSFWSDNYSDIYESLWLKLGAGYIHNDGRFFKEGSIESFYGASSDGAVPMLSAQGRIRLWIPDVSALPELPAVHIDDTISSALDHYSCHRHPNTLEKIMDWLGLPYAEGGEQPMSMKLPFDEGSEPNVVAQYYVAGFSGDFNSLADVDETVSIGNSKLAYFRAITSDVNCSFWLTDPCGVTYDPCYAAGEPNITYNTEDEIFLYEVNSPVPGMWTLNLSTTVVPPNLVDYGLTVFESENIVLFSYSNPSWANTDANILIISTLTENGHPLTGANTYADIILPDVNSLSLTLYDDGLHNDANADDGAYANIFTSTTQIGTYNCQITTTGLSTLGTNYERTSSLSFTVSSPDVSFAGDINDIGIDLNGNGLYNVLRFIIPIDVNEHNEYLLTSALYDSNDSLIRLLSTGEVNFSIGPNNFSLDVLAEDIVTHDVNGPYTLSDIIISDANTGLTIAETNDYNTAAYLVSDFERLDTDGDGLSDIFEMSISSNINLPDSDYDGVTDYDEVGYDGNANSYNPVTDLNCVNPDTDIDGMGDGWEVAFGFDPLSDDGAKDNDDDIDDLTNLQEFQNNTDPNNPDTDFDAMPDGWEVSFGLNPVFYDATQDPDVDGLTNSQEYQNGTNPDDNDTDNDTILDGQDNCKLIYNPEQKDADGDGAGDTCEADISGDKDIDLEDLGMLVEKWLDTNCGDCGGADLDGQEDVDFVDFSIFAENWLRG